MSGFYQESITSKNRIESILKHLETFPFAFVPCENKPQLSQSSSNLETNHDIAKNLVYHQSNRLRYPCSDSGFVELEKYVSALNGASRDIPRHGGRLFSLSPKIDKSTVHDLDQYFDVLVKISNTVSEFTCFYHIGGGTIVRVLRGVTKMYMSEVEDFDDYSKPGFFVQNYYPPKVNGRGSITLNILSNTNREGERDEMPYHFDVASHEIAIALMLGRFNLELRKVLVRAVLFGESVAQHIANKRVIGDSLERVNLENADKLAFADLPSEPDLIACLLLQFGSKVDERARKHYDDFNFYRVTPPHESKLFAHYNWLIHASLSVPKFSETIISMRNSPQLTLSDQNKTGSPASTRKRAGEEVSVSVPVDRTDILTRARNFFFLRNRKLYEYDNHRIFLVAGLYLAFCAVAAYASFGQRADPADAVEKVMSLLFFGTIVTVHLVGARRDEDLVSDVFNRRKELKTSRCLDEVGFSHFLDLLQLDPDVHDSLRPDRCEWVTGDKKGRTKLHRNISLNELKWMVLFIRENGDIFLGDSDLVSDSPKSRKVRLVGSGNIRVEGREEKAYGYIIRAGRERVFLD